MLKFASDRLRNRSSLWYVRQDVMIKHSPLLILSNLSMKGNDVAYLLTSERKEGRSESLISVIRNVNAHKLGRNEAHSRLRWINLLKWANTWKEPILDQVTSQRSDNRQEITLKEWFRVAALKSSRFTIFWRSNPQNRSGLLIPYCPQKWDNFFSLWCRSIIDKIAQDVLWYLRSSHFPTPSFG